MVVIVVFLPVNTLTILQKEDLSLLNRYILNIHQCNTFCLIFFKQQFYIKTISKHLPLSLQCHMPVFRKLIIWEILNQKLL